MKGCLFRFVHDQWLNYQLRERSNEQMNGFWTKFDYCCCCCCLCWHSHNTSAIAFNWNIYKFNGHTVLFTTIFVIHVFFVSFQFQTIQSQNISANFTKMQQCYCWNWWIFVCVCVYCFPSQAHTEISSELLILINLLRDFFLFLALFDSISSKIT